MHAAIVTSFDAPPQYGEYPTPVAQGENEMVVDVLAAGLHPLVKARANGTHYSSTGTLPFVPGVDGVVRDQHGNLRYTVLDDSDLGTLAERTVIDPRRSVVLPGDVDPVRIAAAMNPAMSSWVALRRRIAFREGQRVLVLGATGSAGRMAVQIAKQFGAAYVIAAGRNASRLAALHDLGADETVTFDLADRAADVDVVLDYVWGEPSARAMTAMITARRDRGTPLNWIQIGSVAGRTIPVHSSLLRASRLQICGSGIGSVSPRDFLAELPELAVAVHTGAIDVQARPVPLAQVNETWSAATDDRIVYLP
ncbi:zinc-binding alcohol dehydrogenase family protein [Nocardia gipuzkoensis]|uniref:quinone oxidoreductase family protein n=1 Tax=Nocardia gipuzkoensis TaxID=2749991 RepID=UPI001E44F569|nr:zinc-binding alcohol dehydrogenase family protein [Nocardia gipuzkoensis]UGT67342.1 zinc-binding alcohol dehydrogenase family protein [Nocardia gipuzkoensis]